MKKETVAILGASDNPERYSYMAFKMLKEQGHTPVLVHPRLEMIEGQKVYNQLSSITQSIDTLTLYINPQLQSKMEKQILDFNVKRVIFNPGTENEDLESKLSLKGVETLRACTLVLLRTNQF